MADFQTIISKVLSDAEFRQQLLANPEATLRAEGVEPTPEVLDAFNDATEESLQELANNFNEDQAAW